MPSVDVDTLLGSYPRVRPPLTERHAKVYAEQYRLNREGTAIVEGLAQRLEKWMHRQVASVGGSSILELGAGTLNHLPFENSAGPYDVVEPFVQLYESSGQLGRVRTVYSAVAEIDPAIRYSRIISIAVLEHMTNLPLDLAEAASRLKPDGVFQAGIPSEGGLLWWIGWRFSTGISYYLRTGLDYGVVMRHEHVNSAKEIVALMRWLFQDVRIRRFPLPFHHLSFYSYVEARGVRVERCNQLLNKAPTAVDA